MFFESHLTRKLDSEYLKPLAKLWCISHIFYYFLEEGADGRTLLNHMAILKLDSSHVDSALSVPRRRVMDLTISLNWIIN